MKQTWILLYCMVAIKASIFFINILQAKLKEWNLLISWKVKRTHTLKSTKRKMRDNLCMTAYWGIKENVFELKTSQHGGNRVIKTAKIPLVAEVWKYHVKTCRYEWLGVSGNLFLSWIGRCSTELCIDFSCRNIYCSHTVLV